MQSALVHMQPGTPESDQVKQIDQVFCETGRGTAHF